MECSPGENPVEEVFAFTGTCAHDENVMEAEDTTVATFRYRDGSLGQLLAATSLYPGSGMSFQIAGSDGTIMTQGEDLISWQFHEEMPKDAEIRAKFGSDSSPVDAPDPLETANIEGFLEARNTGASFELDHEKTRKAVEIVEAIYESANSNEPVSLP